jgi:hypothetical protein
MACVKHTGEHIIQGEGSEFRVRVQSLGFRVRGSAFRIHRFRLRARNGFIVSKCSTHTSKEL